MLIYNTLTREKQEFVPLEPGKIKIYACGPTVYNLIHIGNARPLCVFDTLRRYLEYRGYTVTFIQNFTDIDDKIIVKANEEGVSTQELTERYIAEYFVDAQGLNVREATQHPRATQHIDDIIAMVQTLVDKGSAYESQGDVYFRTHEFKDYGKLSHMPLEDLEAGARVAVGEKKESPLDFALWKAAKPGEPSWSSPWGDGRPGWHIECSAMSKALLGPTFDIHGGGQDLIFPHHENEIAQSECANCTTFARYFMHNGYINVDNKKMSKSLGNFFTVREVADKYGYGPIRFLMVASHYRSPINYSLSVIEQCVAALARLHTCMRGIEFALQSATDTTIDSEAAVRDELARCRAQFDTAMDDDLNTAEALGSIFEIVRIMNTLTNGETLPSRGLLETGRTLLTELCDVLGLTLDDDGPALDDDIEQLIEKRQQARASKDFATADAIRDELAARGIALEDTPQGVKWRRL